ncbi:tetratricopeptide repeat protein [Streptomyces sp. NPDC000151]|uniref:tetratricopeptide repeat protein n=1 Tax=Streptomyces sp. NPDC000151 TaxID=3154244 RepID=UPI00332E3665
MYGKAFAPEYQGELGAELSVNSSYEDVLAAARRARGAAGTPGDAARAALAEAEAGRRLGRVAEAGDAWRASYRSARTAQDAGGMAWALWSGGTLARQCGRLALARRLLAAAVELADHGGDRLAHGYALAGLAETGRIQGDYEAVAELHEELLAQARAHGEARHMVWAMSGIAQMHRNTGEYGKALELFEESARIAEGAEDVRGLAWSLRGVADVRSVLGATEEALRLLSKGETLCRELDLAGALAYNRKMRGNVLYRAGRYEEAAAVYRGALEQFRSMSEPRGSALARLGLVKSRARTGWPYDEVLAELDDVEREVTRIGLRHARDMVRAFRAELSAGRTAVPAPGATTRRSPAVPARS